MEKKSNTKIEFRKRKEKKKDKKKKESKKKLKEGALSFHLSIVIFVLIGVNLLFVISFAIHSLASRDVANTINEKYFQDQTGNNIQKALKVEVLNGCGIEKIASELTNYLRKNGIDVVYYGNFESFAISETLVIDRRSNSLENAKIIGKAIGVKEKRMFPQLSPQRQLDVSIIIGKNYKELKAFNQ